MSEDSAAVLERLLDGRVTDVPLAMLREDEHQPRRHFDRAALNDLAADIRVHGVLQPVVVRAEDVGEGSTGLAESGFVVVMGARRVRAAELAGLEAVPAVVSRDVHPLTWRLQQLSENVQREALNPIDLAEALRSLRDDFDLSHADIAKTLKERGFRSMGRSHVANTIRLLDLPAKYVDAIAKGDMPASWGKYIAQVPDREDAWAAFEKSLEDFREDAAMDGRVMIEADVRVCVQETLSAIGYRLNGDCRIVADLRKEGFTQLPFDAQLPAFDVASVCARCPHRRKLTIEGVETLYCIEREAFLEKQRAALEQRAGEVPAEQEQSDGAPTADDFVRTESPTGDPLDEQVSGYVPIASVEQDADDGEPPDPETPAQGEARTPSLGDEPSPRRDGYGLCPHCGVDAREPDGWFEVTTYRHDQPRRLLELWECPSCERVWQEMFEYTKTKITDRCAHADEPTQ